MAGMLIASNPNSIKECFACLSLLRHDYLDLTTFFNGAAFEFSNAL